LRSPNAKKPKIYCCVDDVPIAICAWKAQATFNLKITIPNRAKHHVSTTGRDEYIIREYIKRQEQEYKKDDDRQGDLFINN